MVTTARECAPHSNQVIRVLWNISELYSVSRTDKLSILITLWLIPFSPLVKFWYVIATVTLLPQLWLCVHCIHCLSVHFFSAKSLLQVVVPLMAARHNCANPVCRGITDRCCVSSAVYLSVKLASVVWKSCKSHLFTMRQGSTLHLSSTATHYKSDCKWAFEG